MGTLTPEELAYQSLPSTGWATGGGAAPAVREVFSYADFSTKPSVGSVDALYINLADGSVHYWTGSAYQQSAWDNLVEYANATQFPVTGVTKRGYIAADTNTLHYWDGTAYTSLSGGAAFEFAADADITAKAVGKVLDAARVLDEDTLVSDSALHVPTQQSVKAYIDAKTLPRLFVSSTALGAAITAKPLEGEAQAYATANSVSSVLMTYTGTTSSADPITYIYHVDVAGVVTELRSPHTPEAAAPTHVFADEFTVSPGTAGKPTVGEIQTFVTNATLVNVHLFYTGTNSASDPVVSSYVADSAGTVIPTGSVDEPAGKLRMFLGATTLAAGLPTAPLESEVQAYVTTNSIIDKLIIYTGTDVASDPEQYVYDVDFTGELTMLRSPAVAGGSTHAFADATTVAAFDVSAPTVPELQAFVTANTLTETHVFYTGTDTATDDALFTYAVDSSGLVIPTNPPQAGTTLESIHLALTASKSTVANPLAGGGFLLAFDNILTQEGSSYALNADGTVTLKANTRYKLTGFFGSSNSADVALYDFTNGAFLNLTTSTNSTEPRMGSMVVVHTPLVDVKVGFRCLASETATIGTNLLVEELPPTYVVTPGSLVPQSIADGTAVATADLTLTTGFADVPGVSITLPQAGKYLLLSKVSGYIQDDSVGNNMVVGRLYDQTAGITVPESTAIATMLELPAGSASLQSRGAGMSATIYTVTGPTVIAMQGAVNIVPTTFAKILKANGDFIPATTLTYTQIPDATVVKVDPTLVDVVDLRHAEFSLTNTTAAAQCPFDNTLYESFAGAHSLDAQGGVIIGGAGTYRIDLNVGIQTTNPDLELRINGVVTRTFSDGSISSREKPLLLDLVANDVISVTTALATESWYGGGNTPFATDTDYCRILITQVAGQSVINETSAAFSFSEIFPDFADITGATEGTGGDQIEFGTVYRRVIGNSVTIMGQTSHYQVDGIVTWDLSAYMTTGLSIATSRADTPMTTPLSAGMGGTNNVVVTFDRDDAVAGESLYSFIIEGIL